MRVSDFVSSSFDRFDQQYNTACSGPSSSSTNNHNNIMHAAEEQTHNTSTSGSSSSSSSSKRSGHTNVDAAAVEDNHLASMSFAHSILLDLLRRSNNDLENYGGTTSLPLLLIALARVIIALLSLLLSICGIVLHVLLAVTIRILFAVVDGVSFVQRSMWCIVERVVMAIAIRMDWQQSNNRPCSHHNRSNGTDHHQHHNNSNSSDDITSLSSNNKDNPRGGGGGGIFEILESYRQHLLHQLSLIISTSTTRTKLDRLPDIMNNTPPSLSLFALVTALAFIVHPDGLTWIVLGKLCEGVWMGLQLLRGAATTIVAAILSPSSSSSSQAENNYGSGGGGSRSIGAETLSTIVASAVLVSLIMLGKVMCRALYKKNTVTDAQSSSLSSLGTSSASKKKKGRRGRNSGRHGNHHHSRSGGQRNNKKDDTAAIHPSKQHQPSSRSRSLSPYSTRTNSTTSFVEEEEQETIDDAIPKQKVTTGNDDDEATGKEESKERRNHDAKKDNVSLTDSNTESNNGNGKSSAAQQLPHDPAHDILSKLRPDSTDSSSVPQLLDEDVSLGSSGAGSLVVDCGTKQGGGTIRGGGGGGGKSDSSSNNNNNINATTKRGGARGKSTNNGIVRVPPGFITKDSTSSSTKSAAPRSTGPPPKAYPGKNDDRKQRLPFSPKRKPNHQHHGTRTRASTSDCVIRQYDVHSSPLFSSNNNDNITTGRMTSPAPSLLSSGQNLLHRHEQGVRTASNNELSSPYRTSNQVSHESSLLNNVGAMRNNLNSPISPPLIRPPPGLGFGSPVEMNSFGNGAVGGIELAPANNSTIPGPFVSVSPTARLQPPPQAQQYSAYDQSNFLLQPSVFPSMINNHKMKESRTNEDDRIDADLQELGDQMVGSVLDF